MGNGMFAGIVIGAVGVIVIHKYVKPISSSKARG